ncbi:PREDICTED: uncharacterized protein LOC106813348 [Priapulus caudatus]|uniref:Uncharacterized protein LOC106813348 n=1 Tax=Priapulus caudatus TaxID=37621 RepID=A0ABM1EL92_PRICU|nr:PREDICTED: uncharacterized protein LOC106813348 [Priapulus caudatus]
MIKALIRTSKKPKNKKIMSPVTPRPVAMGSYHSSQAVSIASNTRDDCVTVDGFVLVPNSNDLEELPSRKLSDVRGFNDQVASPRSIKLPPAPSRPLLAIDAPLGKSEMSVSYSKLRQAPEIPHKSARNEDMPSVTTVSKEMNNLTVSPTCGHTELTYLTGVPLILSERLCSPADITRMQQLSVPHLKEPRWQDLCYDYSLERMLVEEDNMESTDEESSEDS